MEILPNVLQFEDGTQLKTETDFAKRRKELLNILSSEEYGFSPERKKATGKIIKTVTKCCCGYAVDNTVEISVPTPNGDFKFPVHHIYPVKEGKYPTFVFMNFSSNVYNHYCPTEEIIERGFSVAVFNYEDVISDDASFDNGIGLFYKRENRNDEWGKIGMWAFAASAVADYILEQPSTDSGALAVIGHSRLGKTALWCGANDERFKYVISNDSGCGGASLESHENGENETTEKICNVFPYWFCKNYQKYKDKNVKRPFDQHFLLSAVAPRYLLVGSAEEDLWADPEGEELCCVASSPCWEIFNKKGYIKNSNEGNIHYHIRPGIHFLGRPDWNAYMDFISEKTQQ